MLPQFIHELIKRDKLEQAHNFAGSETEHIIIEQEAGNDEQAKARAKELLEEQSVVDVRADDDTVIVHAGPFTGYHTIRQDHDGLSPATVGSYIHDPTDVEFGAECPDIDALYDEVQEFEQREPADAAAKIAYRRSRL